MAERYGGRFPACESELLALPGIGPYTAAAIASIAFGVPATPVDGNIERVMARLFAVQEPLPAVKPTLRSLAASLAPPTARRRFRPRPDGPRRQHLHAKAPLMPDVPAARALRGARARDLPPPCPIKATKADRPLRVGLAFVALREDGTVLLRRRPDAGLLGGMLEVPSTDWSETFPPLEQALRAAPVHGQWWAVPGTVTHTFTHFRLELLVYRAVVPIEAPLTFWADPQRCRWLPRRHLNGASFAQRDAQGHCARPQGAMTGPRGQG